MSPRTKVSRLHPVGVALTTALTLAALVWTARSSEARPPAQNNHNQASPQPRSMPSFTNRTEDLRWNHGPAASNSPAFRGNDAPVSRAPAQVSRPATPTRTYTPPARQSAPIVRTPAASPQPSTPAVRSFRQESSRFMATDNAARTVQPSTARDMRTPAPDAGARFNTGGNTVTRDNIGGANNAPALRRTVERDAPKPVIQNQNQMQSPAKTLQNRNVTIPSATRTAPPSSLKSSDASRISDVRKRLDNSAGNRIVNGPSLGNRLAADNAPTVKKVDSNNLGGRAPEIKKLDTQNLRARAPESRKSDAPKPGNKNVGGKSPEIKRLDSNNLSNKSPGGRSPEIKRLDSKNLDAKPQDNRGPGGKSPEIKRLDSKNLGGKAPDVIRANTGKPDAKNLDKKDPNIRLGGPKTGNLDNSGFKKGPAGQPGDRITTDKKGPRPGDNHGNIDDVRKRLGGASIEPKGNLNVKKLPGDAHRPPLDPKKTAGNLHRAKPVDQIKRADLDRITRGETAQKIKLADQYKLHAKGDVARQLHFDKPNPAVIRANQVANAARFVHHGGGVPMYQFHPGFHYHGLVPPTYARSCFAFNYWGPGFFGGLCWYPTWSPWVSWSWGYHCGPLWDPRPVWCRPYYYHPCPRWVYWETPVYMALPVVPSGTWVDLPPVVLPPTESDLQLVAVRFVDPGHPDEKLGPRYRVWFRNNGVTAVNRPFNVMLFASNGDRLTADLPQSGVRVTSIEPGAIQSVDIRLPIEAMTMGRDAQGNPAPFATLHAMVDAHQEVPEATRNNNGAQLPPVDILPVDPAAFEIDPVSAKPGGEVLLAGEGLGPEPGQVLLHIGDKEVQAEIQGWYDLGVRWTVPQLQLAAPTEAEVIVVRGDGAATNPLRITLAP